MYHQTYDWMHCCYSGKWASHQVGPFWAGKCNADIARSQSCLELHCYVLQKEFKLQTPCGCHAPRWGNNIQHRVCLRWWRCCDAQQRGPRCLPYLPHEAGDTEGIEALYCRINSRERKILWSSGMGERQEGVWIAMVIRQVRSSPPHIMVVRHFKIIFISACNEPLWKNFVGECFLLGMQQVPLHNEGPL